ncbi:hypothetical protein PC116_g28834 [Phytophthora cactorum]|uniref:Uncharacterized protein n=1 Tax=Phytophthora cactorum TaxID=29920 RepID=A0A8T1ACM2_9STRA|nr:hypothetical protein PC114_g26911 [Phytophthora cactorum]KAG2879069.1 hypothetical protein PC117_g26832 [Phytophthora cactorum]KAG2959609.1 hypothetical protein PC119_g26657 [Phytophthora cactorum]KAG3031679.1 hypothetical protein PC120_g2976 [Phytophthora cactorum]KAG3123083.1 hypothetical protein C6341_g26702 [Phytophthora cactorum]
MKTIFGLCSSAVIAPVTLSGGALEAGVRSVHIYGEPGGDVGLGSSPRGGYTSPRAYIATWIQVLASS